MGWIGVGVPIIAAFLFGFGEHPFLFSICIGVGLLAFWSFGVMHNFAHQEIVGRKRQLIENMRLEGRSVEELERAESLPESITPEAALAAPNWIPTVNMVATGAGGVLLIWALLVR